MHRIAKTLIAGTALLSLTAVPVCAQESTEFGTAEIINGQINFGDVWSTIDTTIDTAGGDVTAVTQAVGNTVNIYTMANTFVENDQVQNGDVGAAVDLVATDVWGDVLIGATALCNGAMVSTDPDVTAVTSNQECGARDPSAWVDADISNVAGGVGISAAAVGNQIQVDSNARNFPIDSTQVNHSDTISTLNANVSNVGQVDLSGSAVGNSATFIHY